MKKKIKLDKDTKELLKGLEKSYQKMIDFKKYKKSPLIVSKNGKIFEIKPNDIKDNFI